MIWAAAVGPLSVLYILGWPALFLVVIMGVEIGFLVGVGVTRGTPGTGDILSATLATVLVVCYMAVVAGMTLWRYLEAYFSSMPWLGQGRELVIKGGARRYQTRCPFTGLRPTMRCPSCDCRVHDVALKPAERFATALGETVLRWGAVKAALQTQGTVAKVRSAVDQALDFRGSYVFCALSPACVGCSTWQRNFNLAPRLALMLALVALALAFLGWAFASFTDTFAAEPLQGLTEGLSVYFAASALLLQVQAFFRVNAFLDTYRSSIPGLEPVFHEPAAAPLRLLYRSFLATPWGT